MHKKTVFFKGQFAYSYFCSIRAYWNLPQKSCSSYQVIKNISYLKCQAWYNTNYIFTWNFPSEYFLYILTIYFFSFILYFHPKLLFFLLTNTERKEQKMCWESFLQNYTFLCGSGIWKQRYPLNVVLGRHQSSHLHAWLSWEAHKAPGSTSENTKTLLKH